ncbi:hypothetical protein BGZ98_006356 [Dissophora globulifera]|nr:hypothetical protein BGZ98_006356 [Dissophora globulifera]
MANVEMYRAKVAELIRQADITTVSARGIRKQIETLTSSSLANVKREFDELVMEIYEKITDEIERAVLNGGQAPGSNGVHHQQQPQQNHVQPQYQQQPPLQQQPSQTHSFGGFALPPTSYVPPKVEPPKPASVKKVVKQETPVSQTNHSDDDNSDDGDDSDASYSSVEEGNARPSKKAKTSSSSSSKKSSSASKSKTKSKSKTSVSSKKDKDKEKAKVKRKQPVNEDGTPKVNNFTRPMIISDKLYNVIGHAGKIGASGRVEMSRPEVVKQIWVHIKENGLQAENDKRLINCDLKLKTLFGQDQVNCFAMNKYLSGHLSKPEELV